MPRHYRVPPAVPDPLGYDLDNYNEAYFLGVYWANHNNIDPAVKEVMVGDIVLALVIFVTTCACLRQRGNMAINHTKIAKNEHGENKPAI